MIEWVILNEWISELLWLKQWGMVINQWGIAYEAVRMSESDELLIWQVAYVRTWRWGKQTERTPIGWILYHTVFIHVLHEYW